MSSNSTDRFLKEFPIAISDGSAAIFVGAGVSMAAGYPSWPKLLKDIGNELKVKSSDVHDLAALAQWSIQESGGATRVRNVIKADIGVNLPIPEAVEIISRLPIRHIWTTNYDRLVERAFDSINRPIDSISCAQDLTLKAKPGATRLYKMHGSVDRLDDIVISTDDYELFRRKRGAFLPLLQAHLTSKSMLFVGLSFTDPNIKHVLSLIRESFADAPPDHFAIVKPPKRDEFKTDEEHQARLAQHKLWAKDLRRYGLSAIEIDNYGEIPKLLSQIERRVALSRVWISGSWPVVAGGHAGAYAYSVAENLGRRIGHAGLSLVSGMGLVVGSAAISGFLESQRNNGGWDLDRRLIVRPFPQPAEGRSSDTDKWTALRKELARQAGIVIFVGGAKYSEDKLVAAPGVMEEFELSKAAKKFLLPVAATGGAAKVISDQLMRSDLPSIGEGALRPTDGELEMLSSADLSSAELSEKVHEIMARVTRSG